MYEAISVVIPTIPERKEQLAKLLKQLGSKFEVIVVDNQELSLAEKRNYGLAQATGDLIYFLDDDNELFLDTFVDLALIMECNLKVGIAASVAVNGGKFVDGGSKRWLVSGFMTAVWPKGWNAYEVDECANAFMVRRKVFQDIGGFDSQRFPMDMDEADLCLRARRKGWKVVYVPSSRVKHPLVPQVPKFRRRINAYYMGLHRIRFQHLHLNLFGYGCFLVFFLPVFICVYTVSLACNTQAGFIPVFLKGVLDGLFNKFDGDRRYIETT